MIAWALNPGLVLLAAAALVLVCTNTLRLPIMLASAIGAVALSFTTGFGQYSRFAQIGLEITPLQLDPLAQVFGLGIGLATIVLVLACAPVRDRWRDAALLAASGGGAGAIYSGDLISFTAYLETASLAVVALVFCGGGALARRASIEVLAWQACAGACLATGAGLIWGSTGSSAMSEMALQGPGQMLFLLGLLVKAGAAPIAHSWLRACAGASGGIALAAIMSTLPIVALYALLRCFGGSPALLAIGSFMAAYPALLALGAHAPRAKIVHVIASLLGLAVIGAAGGGQLGLAGACALSFALCLGGPLMLLSLEAAGGAIGGNASWHVRGFAWLAAASLLGVPGTLGYGATSLLLDGLARDGKLVYWLLGLLASVQPILAVMALGPGAFAPLAAPLKERPPPPEFSMLLAMGAAAFFIVAIGVDSRWLYALLPPGQLLYTPYDTAQLLARGQSLCAAGLVTSLMLQVQARYSAKAPKKAARSSGDVFAWLSPLWRGADRFLLAGAARRASARASIERAVLDFSRAGLDWFKSSETGIFREILGPGMVLVLAAGLALGLLINGG